MSRQAERILDSVREAITGLTGSERIVTATTVALQRMRAAVIDVEAPDFEDRCGVPGISHIFLLKACRKINFLLSQQVYSTLRNC